MIFDIPINYEGARAVRFGMSEPGLRGWGQITRIVLCHSRESGNPVGYRSSGPWIPAFAGMTIGHLPNL
jgi:hypothetical protein